MQRILQEIYSSIDDPDGIYAVAQSGDTASQLRLMQHEGARSGIAIIWCLLTQPGSYCVVMQHAGVFGIHFSTTVVIRHAAAVATFLQRRRCCTQAIGVGRLSQTTSF